METALKKCFGEYCMTASTKCDPACSLKSSERCLPRLLSRGLSGLMLVLLKAAADGCLESRGLFSGLFRRLLGLLQVIFTLANDMLIFTGFLGL